MSVSILPEIKLREEGLKAARRRGIRHVAAANRPSSLQTDSNQLVRRSKSEHHLPEVPTEDNQPDLTIEARKDRISAIIAAVETQKTSVAFSGHRNDLRRPGSGNSSLGSRAVSFHSLCTGQTGPAVPKPVKNLQPARFVSTKNDSKFKRHVLNPKAPVMNFAPKLNVPRFVFPSEFL